MLKPERTLAPEPGVVLFVMPFGERVLAGREACDFDQLYATALAPTVESCGMKPVRLDTVYGPQGILELIWQEIQRAELIVIDFSFRSANVNFEYGLAWTLGKRVVALAQDEADIPSDVRGLNRYIRYSQHFADIERMKRELALQLEALRDEPAEERAPMPYTGGGASAVPAAATVIAVERDYATVRTDDGRLGFLRAGDVEYARFITDMTRRYKVGDALDGAFVVDPQRGEARYTMLAGRTNPWPLLASRYPVGTTFHGIVHHVIAGVGIFVRVDEEVNGLVPAETINGSAPSVGDNSSHWQDGTDPAFGSVSARWTVLHLQNRSLRCPGLVRLGAVVFLLCALMRLLPR
jgi:small subunit ribosomal protein S1